MNSCSTAWFVYIKKWVQLVQSKILTCEVLEQDTSVTVLQAFVSVPPQQIDEEFLKRCFCFHKNS